MIYLAEFLKARLDEDEQAAQTAAAANPGAAATHWSAEQVDYQSVTGVRSKAWAVVPERVRGVTIAISPTDIQPRFTTHIARHDPARVLAEVEVKRQILAEHAEVDGVCRVCTIEDREDAPYGQINGGGPELITVRRSMSYPCTTVRLLVLPDADHEDCREERRP